MPATSSPDLEASASRTHAYFQELGSRIETEWARTSCDDRRFGALAEAALLDAPPQGVVTPESIMHWALLRPSLGLQPNAEFPFGEPPITLFTGRRFYIDALFWLDGTTSIHQHGFDGAFCVLHGGSIHSTYDFIERDVISG